MKLRIFYIDSHRNGICGAPFHAVVFRDGGPEGSVKLGIVFDEPNHVAVLDIAKLAEFDIAFGSNSWRGDRLEPALRRAIAGQRTHVEAELPGRSDETKPVIVVTVRGGTATDVNANEPATVFVEDWDCPPDRPLIMDFVSEPLTADQEQRVRQRLAENEAAADP